MAGAYSKVVNFYHKYPIVRGMTAYAILWPISSILQETLEKKEYGNYNWARVFRFGLFGSCFVAPTLYGWIRVSSKIWPGKDLLSSVKKGVTEQVAYSPFANAAFFFGMSALERKSFNECIEEVKAKFWPTWKVALCFWPFIATINYRFIKEKNRVAFISFCSLFWVIFLAHMKSLERERLKLKQLQHQL